MEQLLIQLVSGAIGGNIAGGVLKNQKFLELLAIQLLASLAADLGARSSARFSAVAARRLTRRRAEWTLVPSSAKSRPVALAAAF